MRTGLIQLGFVLLLAMHSAFAGTMSSPKGAPGSISVGQSSITYYARQGDTLSSISQQWTTRAGNWTMIGKLNRIEKDVNIPIGTAILIPGSVLPEEPSRAKIIAFSGSVTITGANGQALPLSIGTAIDEGAKIVTGANGFLTLALPDSSRMSLPSNSQVQLSKLRAVKYTKSPITEVTLQRGRVESRVSPLDRNGGRYEVRTPLSQAGVRGTHFRVSVTDKGVTNEVLAGSVETARADKRSPVLIKGGQGNVVTRAGVGAPVALLPAPRIVQVRQVNGSLSLSLSPVTGARAYHVQIAKDADAQDVIAETTVASHVATMDGLPLPKGQDSYFARLTAIDPNGLEGQLYTATISAKGVVSGDASVTADASSAAAAAGKADTASSLAVGTPALSAPRIEDGGEKYVMLRWNASAARKYRLQIARDASFSWILTTADTTEPAARILRPVFGTYYARVQILNEGGSVNATTAAQGFIVTDHWVIHDGSPITSRGTASEPVR